MNLYNFFDTFGIFVFAFIALDAAAELKAGKSSWRTILRFIIGIVGLLVDGFLVFVY